MKKNLLFSLMAACALTFTACSDDDDPMISPSDLSTTFGTDATTSLNLSYSDSPISGKQVKFYTKDSKTASITLMDVIPGQAEAVIDNIKLTEAENEYIFSGASTITRATGYTVNYSGSVKKGELTLKLNVTVPDPQGWAKNYALGNYTPGSFEFDGNPFGTVVGGALYVEWGGIEDPTAPLYSGLLRAMGGILLPQVVKTVMLETDGNVRAEYAPDHAIVFDQDQVMGMLSGIVPDANVINALIPTTGWQSSPKNLAYWFEKDNQLYLKLNVSAIVSQTMDDNATEGNETLVSVINSVLNGDPASIKSLIGTLGIDLSKVSDETFITLLDWVKNGIPMQVKTVNGHTYIYLDKDALAPLLKLYGPEDEKTSDIVQLWTALAAANLIPEEAQSAGFFIAVLSSYYNMSTVFNLGFDLK